MTAAEKIARLRPFVSEPRQALIDEVASKRTRHITLVFEDIEKSHNISAVLRTAECMGVQDVHFIRNKLEYNINPGISMGAVKWLTLHRHNESTDGAENVTSAYKHLREKGYLIYATSLRPGAKNIEDIPTDRPVAIIFGAEGAGISKETADMADGLVKIPMHGFTESFNLSVSAAVILTVLLKDRSAIWNLSEVEKQELIAEWYQKSVRESGKILARKE